MRLAVGADEKTGLTDALLADLAQRGHSVTLFGPLNPNDPDMDWPLVAAHVAEAVANGRADQGIVACWTGTGVSLAANKVPGVRAALAADAATAKGARIWNHANILALSLRTTSVPILKEILTAWFDTPIDTGEAQSDWNRLQQKRLAALDAKYRR